MAGRTLFLIDGSAFIHRAFHAIKSLRTSRGQPTNALYGLATMLLKFMREKAPVHCAMVFDPARETFRHSMYAEYKANRPPLHPDLASQFPVARRLARALGLPVLEVPGFEADDVIATFTRRALDEGMTVSVESGDKDMFQLVGEGVAVHDPMKDRTYGPEEVIAKLGVPPERVVDYLALVGDSSDNVPGVAGIGGKGAAELVTAHGSLESIYSVLESLPPRWREALEAGRADAFLSRDLVTLRRDVPIEGRAEDLRPRQPDPGELRAVLTELEFGSLLAEVREAEPVVETRTYEVRIREAGADLPWDALPALIAGAGEVAVVASFGARDPSAPDCKAVAFALGRDDAVVARPDRAPAALWWGLADALGRRGFCAVGFKELSQLWAARGADLPSPAIDPPLAGYVLHPERESQSLETLALELLGEALPPPDDASTGAMGRRALAAARVAGPLAARVAEAGLAALLEGTEIPLARCLAEMETRGVVVDRESLSRISVELARELQRLEGAVIAAAGMPFNPNSPKQLAEVLFGKLGFPVVRKTKTGPSTDSAVLEVLSDNEMSARCPVPQLILEYRSLAKLKSTYADALPALINTKTGRVHTSYNQMVTATGRLSSSDPNLQNIPVRSETGRRIRSAFVSAPGYEFVSADYSQIELRVLAHLSRDEQLIDAFLRGVDIHARTAARIFRCGESEVTPERRRTAKAVNFGLLYGMGAFRLGRDLKIGTHEAVRVMEEYFSAFPGVKGYLEWTAASARDRGWVETATGRRRVIEGLRSSSHNERAAAERMALNTPIQGTAADVIKVAMVRLRERLVASGLDAHMVLQVHDELVLEVREGQGDAAAAILVEAMEGAFDLTVPLKVDVGRGRVWSELHG